MKCTQPRHLRYAVLSSLSTRTRVQLFYEFNSIIYARLKKIAVSALLTNQSA